MKENVKQIYTENVIEIQEYMYKTILFTNSRPPKKKKSNS